MSAAPPISIGMPVYNGEKYIVQALDSILGQTYSDFELIISDNASDDRTAEICQDFANAEDHIQTAFCRSRDFLVDRSIRLTKKLSPFAVPQDNPSAANVEQHLDRCRECRDTRSLS